MDIKEEKADKFVEILLTEGATAPCDDTSPYFKKNEDLPPFYDEELFKKGQEFYHKNIFAIFGGKLFGLISVLAIPSILRILIHTRMSGSEMTAYKRYVATIFHMTVWYESDFKPGSKLWRSIAEVRALHNSASTRGCKAGLNRISQKDMALTQFGFMGYQVVRSKQLGVYYSTEEEWKAFIHLWRVVGYILGIEDRFNICSGSVAETKAICNRLLEKVFIPNIKKNDPEFLQMSRYLVNGLWAIQPLLNFNVSMCALNIVLIGDMRINIMKLTEHYKRLTLWEKILFHFLLAVWISLRWTPFIWYHNHTRYRDMWLMRNFPFLAYYMYGFKDAHVKILAKGA